MLWTGCTAGLGREGILAGYCGHFVFLVNTEIRNH